jgi:hypothetical protein
VLGFDHAVHHVKHSGEVKPKVFKLRTLELGARATVTLEKRHSFKLVTTRRYYPGRHPSTFSSTVARSRARFELTAKAR